MNSRTADLPTMFKELVKGVLKTNPVTGIPYRLGEKAYSAGQSIRDWFGGGDSSSSGGDIGVASGDIGASSGKVFPVIRYDCPCRIKTRGIWYQWL